MIKSYNAVTVTRLGKLVLDADWLLAAVMDADWLQGADADADWLLVVCCEIADWLAAVEELVLLVACLFVVGKGQMTWKRMG